MTRVLFALALTLTLASFTATLTAAQVASATIVVPTEQATTAQDRDAFIGIYNPVAGCVSSATCCCSNTPLTITAGTSAKEINLAGTTDGTAACMGQTTLSGAFSLYQPLAAYSYIPFVPVLFQLQTDPTHEWLQLNTTKTSCNNVFQRAAPTTVTDLITNPQNLSQSLPNLVNSVTQGSVNLPATTTTPASSSSLPTNPFGGSSTVLPQTGTSAAASNVIFPSFNMPALGSNPFAPATSAQTVTFPALTTDQLSQPPNFSQPPFGQLPGGFPAQQQQQGQQQTVSTQVMPGGSIIQPTSTSIPFNSQLPFPNPGSSSPFQINSLTAVPNATSSNPFPQLGGSNSGPLPQLPGMTTNTSPSTVNTQSTTASPSSSSSSSVPNLPTGSTPPAPSSPIGGFSTAAANSSVQYTQQLVEASGSGAPAGSKNYLAAFTVPAASNVKFVILHYYTMGDMRQKNVYMNLTSSVGLASQLIQAASASPALTPSSNYYVFVHGPITVENSDVLTYSFTYSTKADGSSAMNTPQYSYSKDASATTLATVSVPQDAMAALPGLAIVDSAAQTTTSTAIDTSSIWNGQFQADSSCVPSDTCCCGVGIMNVSTTTANPTEALIAGALDGGAGCLYQTSLTGLMKINSTNPNMASRSIEIPNAEKTTIVFTAQLSNPPSGVAAAGANSVLTISNTFRPCATVAMKIGSLSTGPSTPSDPSTTDPTILNTNTNNTTNSSSPSSESLPRDAFIGDYDFDTSCEPSESCCCAQGALNIAPVYDWTVMPALPPAMAALAPPTTNASSSNHSNEIIFAAMLDGGSACVGMKNVSQVFKVLQANSATFNFPPLTLSADLTSSSASSTLDTVTFKNSLYPTCVSTAHRRLATENSTSSSSTPPTTTSSNTTVPITPPTTGPALSDAEMTALRESYIGDWESTGCVVSASCCCTTGITHITANSSAPNLVNVDTALTGSGFSCLQKDGPVKMTFTLLNATSAEASPFDASTVKFHAAQAADSKERIIVTNTVHPSCPTTLVKRPPTSEAGSIQTNTIVLGLALAAGSMAIAITH